MVAGSRELLQRTSLPGGAGDCDWPLVRCSARWRPDFCSISPWRSSGEFEGARRSGRSGALALSLALGRRLFEQYPKFKQYDSSVTSDCSQAVYIVLNGMAKNILHVPVWRPEQDSNLRPTA
jgi:hypothetical protein